MTEGDTDCESFVSVELVHPAGLVAEHDVAPMLVQVSVVGLPAVIGFGLAESETVGATGPTMASKTRVKGGMLPPPGGMFPVRTLAGSRVYPAGVVGTSVYGVGLVGSAGWVV